MIIINREILHHQSNSAFFFNKNFSVSHNNCINLLNSNRLTIFAEMEFAGVDLFNDLFEPHSVSARGYEINYCFVEFHNAQI